MLVGFFGRLNPIRPGLGGRLSDPNMLWNPGITVGGICGVCRFGALGGSSSSSLLKVRSTTWPMGLLPVADRPVVDVVDCSRDDAGGVLVIDVGVRMFSLFMAATRGRSLISTRSSSSLSERSPGVCDAPSMIIWDQLPFGSIAT